MISISGAAAFYYNPNIQYIYHNETAVRVIALIYPLFLMIWVILVPLPPLKYLTVHNISYYQNKSIQSLIIAVSFLFIIVSLVALFSVVPFHKTGLYANLFNPSNALVYRENTFKLLPNANVKRLLSHAHTIFIPFAFGIAFLKFRDSKKAANRLPLIAIMIIALFCAGINGARGPIGYLLLLIGILYMLEVGTFRGIVVLFVLVLIALMIAFLFTAMRRGELQTAGLDRMFTFAFRILRRAFLSPFETGLLHNEYAAFNGTWGPGVIGFPFKNHLLEEHVNYYRIVGSWYNNTILGINSETTNLNTSFIFSQQAIWGIGAGTIISYILIVLSDLFIYFIYKLPANIKTFAHGFLLWELINVISTDIFWVYWSIIEALIMLWGFIIVYHYTKIAASKNSRYCSEI